MAASVPYLQVDHLTKSYGDLLLFRDISFGVAQGQRIALIAQNGKGKSTLLNILAGEGDYDSGSVVFRRDLKVSCLPQEPQFDPASTVLQACFRTDSEVVRTIARYEQKIARSGEEVMDAEMEELLHLMDFHRAWDYEVRVKQILTRLNIPDFSRPMGLLSGGERKRVALANALISEPELLILDEPTNHLDLPMTEWLEKYLVKSGITLLMVTHDRYFLDRVCTRILEIDDRQLYAYDGNYSYYLEKRQQRIDASNAELERANNLFRHELAWMRRTPSARGTKARARKDAFQELREQVSQHRSDEHLQLDVKATYIGSKIFEARYVSKAYGDQVILRDFYYNFARYEKLGIIGGNGSGKSTFLKMLLGLEPCDKGSFDIGETVTFGYYSQDGMPFDEDKKVIDVVREISDDITLNGGRRLSASQLLSHFLFTPETQHNYVHKLSGGEKRRLYLCTVLMRNPNFLVLDEPTNDLDIVTLNILEEYLRSFKGCVLVVSHDRFFMDKIVDHLLVFEGEGRVQDFPGNYSQYRQWRDEQEEEQRRQRQSAVTRSGDTRSGTAKGKTDTARSAQGCSGAQASPDERQASPARRRNRRSYKEQKEYEALEQEIAALDARRRELEDALSGGQLDTAQIEAYCRELPQLKEQLDAKELRWLELDEIES